MRRKDGKPKTKARRTLPSFEYGLRKNPHSGFLQSVGLETSTSGTPHYDVVSFFSGCGGLDLGFHGGFQVFSNWYRRLPFNIKAAFDLLPDAVAAYKLNLADEVYEEDLTQAEMGKIPKSEVLLGGFPCQDFSSSGPKSGLNGERGKLYLCMRDYMQVHRPKVVVGENVPHLARLNGGKYLRTILSDLEAVGYKFDVWELNCPDYGLPQSRRRLFIVGVPNESRSFPHIPKPTYLGRPFTIDKALSDLEDVVDESVTNQSQYYVSTRATAGGGQGDHTNKAGDVAYCIRSNPRGRIQFHYKLDRRLTVRECARLQSFPDEFVFPFSTQRNLALIGNAVPPIIGHLVGESISEYLSRSSEPRDGREKEAGWRSHSIQTELSI